MAKETRLDKFDQMKEHLEAARKMAAEISDLPQIGYRGVSTADLKLDDDLIAILKYVGNGCPNIYYADEWGASVINPAKGMSFVQRMDEMIGAVEMAKIQANIGEIAPEVAARLRK